MAIDDLKNFDFDNIDIVTKIAKYPQFTVMYGKGGVGKSSAACYSPNPVILAIGRETGHQRMDVPKLENKNNINPVTFVYGTIKYLIEKPHSRETLIIDNAGTFRESVDEDVIAKNPTCGSGADKKEVESISDYGYGKGAAMAYPYWVRLMAGIDMLMRKRNMHVILMAHPVLYNVNLEDGSYYSRTGIAVPAGENTSVRGLMEARAHNVFYMEEGIPTSTVKGNFGGDKKVATSGESKRIIYTKPSGTFFAKSRVDMDKVYIINKSPTETELLHDKTNESLINFWADVYK